MMRPYHLVVCALFVGGLATGVGSARAASPAPVHIALPDCATPPVDSGELITALGVELGAAGIPLTSDAAASGTTRVTLDLSACAEDAQEIRITIDFVAPSISKASLSTRLSLLDVPPESRPRTVAVAVAELLRVTRPPSEGAPPEESPTPAATLAKAPARPPMVTTPPRASPASARHVLPVERRPAASPSYGASAVMAWLARGEDAFAGVGAELAIDLESGWRPRLGLDLLRNSAWSQLGEIDLTVLSAVVGYDRRFGARPVVAVGPEVRVSAVRAKGQSVLGVPEEAQLSGFAGAGARVTLDVPLFRRVQIALALFSSVACWGAELNAGGQRAVAFVGLQGGGTVGVAFQ